jgi:hypothetical protein
MNKLSYTITANASYCGCEELYRLGTLLKERTYKIIEGSETPTISEGADRSSEIIMELQGLLDELLEAVEDIDIEIRTKYSSLTNKIK